MRIGEHARTREYRMATFPRSPCAKRVRVIDGARAQLATVMRTRYRRACSATSIAPVDNERPLMRFHREINDARTCLREVLGKTLLK